MGAAGFEESGHPEDRSKGEADEARERAGSGACAPGTSAGERGERAICDLPLPSAVPSFLEACGKLAAEAAARGDFVRARELVEKAARVAALREAVA